MKNKIYLIILLLVSIRCFPQIPEEAFRLSWQTNNGTARNQAIGGAMTSLGGDATTNFINPAGLAFFNTSDFVFTPSWQMSKNKGSFRGTSSRGSQVNKFRLGTTGLIFGGMGYNRNTSCGITVTQVADFNQNVFYKGQNNYSSFAEPLADEFFESGIRDPNVALNADNISLLTKMAIYTYLVDTATINGLPGVIARSENANLRDQENTITTTGGITEATFGVGGRVSKKVMAGFSLGIPVVKMERNTFFKESDATNSPGNEFDFFTYSENYRLTGIGINAKFGVIVRPQEYIRLGAAIHSPSWLDLKEEFSAAMETDIEDPNSYSVSSEVFTGNTDPQNKYILMTPAKIMISGAYVFREEEKIERQRGFITADIEYAANQWIRFLTSEQAEARTGKYNTENAIIKNYYKGSFNFKAGGELKFKILMLRAGFAYFSNPYKDKELKANRLNISGGLGYRNKGIFIDLTYVHRISKDVNFPYRVNAPRLNTFANLKDAGGNVLLTLGFKI